MSVRISDTKDGGLFRDRHTGRTHYRVSGSSTVCHPSHTEQTLRPFGRRLSFSFTEMETYVEDIRESDLLSPEQDTGHEISR